MMDCISHSGALWDVCTCSGRGVDQLGVVCAHDYFAVGAGSDQQCVHSHTHVLHQVKLDPV